MVATIKIVMYGNLWWFMVIYDDSWWFMVILGMVYGIGLWHWVYRPVYHKGIAIHPDPPGVSMEERFACWDARIWTSIGSA